MQEALNAIMEGWKMVRKQKRTKRRLFSGVLLEVATLVAMFMLAQPSWIVSCLEALDANQQKQQQSVHVPPPTSDTPTVAHARIVDAESHSQGYYAPVLPRADWLPSYFEVADVRAKPPLLAPIFPRLRPGY